MTIKEIADITGYTVRGVSKHIAKNHPSIITEKGTKTELSDDQAFDVLNGLKVELQRKTELRTQFQQDRTQFQANEYALIADAVAAAIARHIMPLVMGNPMKLMESPPQQIENMYLTARAYCVQNNLSCDSDYVMAIAHKATKYSHKNGLPIQKIPDDRFGYVNGYIRDALDAVI